MTTVSAAAPDLNTIVKSVDQIATLPDITARVVQAAEDPRNNAFELLKIVSYDPALAAKILKVVNSSFYGLPVQITSLGRAIALLGMNAVKNLAVASSISTMFRGGEICRGLEASDLWNHSIAVAVCARELARGMKLEAAEEAFLVGLLHDVGLLLEHQLYPEQLREICDESRAGTHAFRDLEHQRLGFDHAQLGGAVAQRWKFPAGIAAAIRHHHDPTQAPAEQRSLAWLVYVADTVCCQSSGGFNLTSLHQQIDDAAMNTVPLTWDVLNATREKLPSLIEMCSPFR
jgi:putative nucleotidyltransferase with HDIG domain